MPLIGKFMEIYHTCCLNSRRPLKVKTVGANKCLNVNADRLEAEDWKPLTKALRKDCELHGVSIRSFSNDTRKCLGDHLKPSIDKPSIVDELIDSVTGCMNRSQILTTIQLQAVPMNKRHVNKLSKAVEECKSLQNLVLTHFELKDEGLMILYNTVCPHTALHTVDFTGCGLTGQGALIIAKIIKVQCTTRFNEMWKLSLRYREPNQDLFPGIRRFTLNDNPQIGDEGGLAILHELMDDLWIKAVDMQNCGLSEVCGKEALSLIQVNETIRILDVSQNSKIAFETKRKIKEILSTRSKDDTKSKMGKKSDSRIIPHYDWLDGSSVRTKRSTSRNPTWGSRKQSSELSQITERSRQDVASSYPSTSQTTELHHTKKKLSDTKRDLLKEREKREEIERQNAKLAEKFNKEWYKRKRLERERDILKEELQHVYSSGGSTPKSKAVTTLSSLKTISKIKTKKTQKKMKEAEDNKSRTSAVPNVAKNGHTAHKNSTKVLRTSSKAFKPVDTNEFRTDQSYDEVRNTQHLHVMQKKLDKLNFNAGNAMPMRPESISSHLSSMTPWTLSQPHIQSSPCQSRTQFTPSKHTIQSSPSPTMTPWSLSQPRNQSSPSRSMEFSQNGTQSTLTEPITTDSEIDSNVQHLHTKMKMEDYISENRTGFENRMPRDLDSKTRSQWIFGELMLRQTNIQQNVNTDFRLRANAR